MSGTLLDPEDAGSTFHVKPSLPQLTNLIGCVETALEVAETDFEQDGGPEATIIEQLEAALEYAKGLTLHVPLRLWSERPGEVSWRCSCGAVMKHQRLPGGRFGGGGSIELRCIDDLIAEATERVNRACDEMEGQIVLDGDFIDGDLDR